MDCSTYSNKTGIGNETHDNNVTESDISEQYYVLKKQFETLSKNFDCAQQELHESKRNYQIAMDLQKDLTTELDNLRLDESKRTADFVAKVNNLQEEIKELRSEKSKTTEAHAVEIEKLQSKIEELAEKLCLKNVEAKVIVESKENVSDDLLMLRNENNLYLGEVTQHKKALEESKNLILNLKEQIKDLTEELTCVKDNLSSKKDELLSVNENLHSTQSELAFATIEIQKLKSQGVNHAAKGNSLFAEVEDKRQEMAKTLIQMKQKNNTLKRELANKTLEVESLLNEKKTLWEEYAGLAAHHDAELINEYEERITQLTALVEQQRRERVKWFSKAYEPGSSDAADWVQAVLAHLQSQCDRFADNLNTCSFENLEKANNIRDLHRQIASWKLKVSESNAKISELERKLKESEIDLYNPVERSLIKNAKVELKFNNPKKEIVNNVNQISDVKKEKNVSEVKKKVTF